MTASATYSTVFRSGVVEMNRNVFKMYPLFTKVYSEQFGPLRLGFRIAPNSVGSPFVHKNAGYTMLLT